MLNLHLNARHTLLKFDQQLPVYNWYYPFPSVEDDVVDTDEALQSIPVRKDGHRALYFHIPFCDTLCTFCPFYRSTHYTYHEFIDQYLEALFLEMKWKSKYPGVGKVPVDIIAVGGGTPSVLSAEQILRFGSKLREHFDLSELKEFTFELEVKSVTLEKLQAMKSIGVNRVSYGIQTFNETYREVFNITSTLEQVRQVSEWATSLFEYVNVDLIFGMAGQSLDDLLAEADAAIALGTTTIDFYPLNYMSASLKMHRSFKEKGLEMLSPSTKTSYRMFLDEYMRAQGYHPINGYSYTRPKQLPTERTVLIREPIFLYHDMLYGYQGDEVIGFGSSAISQVHNYTMVNPNSMEGYIKAMQTESLDVTTIENLNCPEKGIVYFPYRGVLDKKRIDWERVPQETIQALQEAVDQGLVLDEGTQYTLSPSGWLFYVNLVYFLTPEKGKQWLSQRIEMRIEEGRSADEVKLYQII
ncbi:coproporphyrinogen III oxidase family protein [Tumebacillus sp. ITR2]|uniref:Heme chaperone HemW n=1 Tax=Tumebacillus amylolyticus TaxID=2801339 RepID=A0ABS1JDR7_9BACL|nr:coproporphyrinogen-III oxidase family protein [Tumebacillus amylolyticus]MBL0388416.1 coproporphyrinogen III oxidase family protein [Tumebacillus amylolyticus]